MITGKELLDKYNEALQVARIKKEHGFCVITNTKAKNDGILLVGMNPSNPKKEIKDSDPIEYLDCKKKAEGGNGDPSCFWGPKHEMMGRYDNQVNYIDLLPIKLTRQDQVDCLDNNYRAHLLEVTQQHIEDIKPRLIILVNWDALYYWGYYVEHPWMGYSLELIKTIKNKWELYLIKGLQEENDERLNIDFFKSQNNKTKLNGCYLLRYCQVSIWYKRPAPELKLTEKDIEGLLKEIDPDWEKTLY